uniref:Uncharacterized protein n=1 Tax=Heliothis virescens TaxID=7102 RepID=A0A2A4JX10_HELVI
MERRDKKYFVVSFLELPHPNIEKYVCVPRSWVTLRPEEPSSLVAYPNENPELTRNRIENVEPCERHWPRYQATIAYITDEYDDADNWIATMYDDGLTDFNYSNVFGSHLTTTSNAAIPDKDPFDVIDKLLSIKKEEPASPPATDSSTWELLSNHSPSPIRNEEQLEKTQNNQPDITNPESQISLKRSILSEPDQNNNAKQAKLDSIVAVHDNSNISDKPLNNCKNAGEKDLESYIDSFLNELQLFIKANEVPDNGIRDGAPDDDTVTSSIDTNGTTDSQAPISSDKVNSQPPNPTKLLISVVSDEYLLENRGLTPTSGQRNDSTETSIPEQNPVNISAAQTLINLNKRQKELSKAVPNTTQSHLQLPLIAPIEDRRPSNLHFRKIAPKSSPTAQQPINTVQEKLQSQPKQTERKPPINVPQSNAQIQRIPSGLTEAKDNRNTSTRSLPKLASPGPRNSRQLSMPDLESDSCSLDIPPPQYVVPNKSSTAQQPTNTVQKELASQQTQKKRSLPQNNSQIPMGPAGCQNTLPSSLPDNLTSPETHAARLLSMPDLERHDSSLIDMPSPFSPSDVLFIAESPAPSIVNTEIRQNTAAASIENLVPRQSLQEPNLPAVKEMEQRKMNKIYINSGVEYDKRSATVQRSNNSTSETNNMTNSSSVVNGGEPLVPLTVELLSYPDYQQPKLPQRKRGRKPNTFVTAADKIDRIIKQQKVSPDTIKLPPLKQECSKAVNLSEATDDSNLTLLVKGFLLEDPSSGVLFVQPCANQNILEPTRSNPIKQEYIGNTTANQDHCTRKAQELHLQHSHSQEQCQERRVRVNSTYHIPHPEIDSQNIQQSMPMNRYNDRPDPQMNLHNTQHAIRGHQESNYQNTRHPLDMNPSYQRPGNQMDQREIEDVMNDNNVRNDSRMYPQGIGYMATNGSNHRPDGHIGPYITRRPTNMNEAPQGLGLNTRNPIDIDPRRNVQRTQRPINGTHGGPNIYTGPLNTQRPINGSNQRVAQPRGQHNAPKIPNPMYTGNPLDVLNDNIQKLQAQIDALRALPPSHLQTNVYNQRPNPQNTGHCMNMHSQSFDPQTASQFLENTRQSSNGSNRRTIPQINPKNIGNRVNASNHRTDTQTGLQNTRQPMYINNSNLRPGLQIDEHSRNVISAGNQMPERQMNSRNIRPTYTTGVQQGLNSQMSLQNTNPMHGSTQRPDITGMQQRLDAQMDHQNNGAQNWNTENQSSVYNNSFGRQNPPVSQNHQGPPKNTAGERPNIDFGRHLENRPLQSQNNGISYQQSGSQARNSGGQRCTYNPMTGSNQMCNCESCYWKHFIG